MKKKLCHILLIILWICVGYCEITNKSPYSLLTTRTSIALSCSETELLPYLVRAGRYFLVLLIIWTGYTVIKAAVTKGINEADYHPKRGR